MNDNPLIHALKEVCSFLKNSKIEYMLVRRAATSKYEGRKSVL